MGYASEAPVINQFPQPARPANSYNLSFQFQCTNPQPSSSAQPSTPNLDFGFQGGEDAIEDAVEQAMRNERKDIGEEVAKRILEVYHKLPPTVRDQLNLDAILRKLEEKGFIKSEDVKSRGLEGSSDSHKLQRFKIRTVVAEEVVKEDDDKK